MRSSSAVCTWGTLSTAWCVSSDRHTHRRSSSRGQAPVLGEAVTLAGSTSTSCGDGPGDRQVVGAEVAAGQVADHRAGRHAEQARAEHLEQARQHGVGPAVGDRPGRHDRIARRGGRAQRAGQVLEQRPVGLERALGPDAGRGGHHLDGAAGHGEVEPGGAPARAARRCGRARPTGCGWSGSMLASGAPSVASMSANWRAASQFSGPCWPSRRASRPGSRTPRRGSSAGPGSLTRAW